jgi:acetyl esterase
MALAPDIRRLVDRLGTGTPFPELGPERARFEYADRIRGLAPRVPRQVRTVEDTDLGGVPVRVYRPADTSEAPAPGIVFFHGGGWVVGDLDTHDMHCRAATAATNAIVVSVDYRRAPEHPYPAALDDCWTVTEHVARGANDLGIDRTRLAVAGDSAGGNLAAAVALRARDAAMPLRAQLLIYPVTDPTMACESYKTFADDYYLTAEAMSWFIASYLPDPATRTLPYAGPLHAPELAGLAPALLVTAAYDPLRDEGMAYAERLRQAGVPTREISVPATVHGFLEFVHEIPAALRARDDILRDFTTLLRADQG